MDLLVGEPLQDVVKRNRASFYHTELHGLSRSRGACDRGWRTPKMLMVNSKCDHISDRLDNSRWDRIQTRKSVEMNLSIYENDCSEGSG